MAKRLTIKLDNGDYISGYSIITLINRLGEYEDLYPDIDVLRELSKCKEVYKED